MDVGMSGGQIGELLDILRQRETPQDAALYLVGGAVRDILRGRAVHDLDLVTTAAVRPLARRVANRLGGDFYMLDVERNTARVIYHAPAGGDINLDFCALRAPDLEADLRDRDFTVNAIAIELRHPDRLIDPTGGREDLRSGLLRACSPTALERDPVRVLRGVRQSLSQGFHIQPETLEWMRQAAPLLTRISPERQRDELFRILEDRSVSVAIRMLEKLNALEPVLPELAALKGVTQSPPHTLDVWEHTLETLTWLVRLWEALVEGNLPESPPEPEIAMAAAQLRRYRAGLAEHFRVALNPNRSLRGLLFLAALYHDVAKPLTRSVEPGGRIRFLGHDEQGAALLADRARVLALSQVEIQRLEAIVRQHMRIHLLADMDGLPSKRAIFRFFRDTGPGGIDMALLSLADMLATYGKTLAQPVWEAEIAVVRVLFEAWFERPAESVRPPRLVSGDDLMAALGMPAGSALGRLLADIQEAQAAGEIATREQALEFARRRSSGRNNDE